MAIAGAQLGTTTVPVRVSHASYPVEIGTGLLAHVGERVNDLLGGKIRSGKVRAFVITSPELQSIWGESLLNGFAQRPTVLLVPAGEQHKRLATIERLAEELAEHGADRSSTLIAFGGGVIGDLVGFLAAIYMRGIPYIQVPTTLLAQVDSSVGGKTGANLAAGKNLIGAFHHPLAVYADIATLSTLPPRELRAGLQEAIKAGIIRDRPLFDFLDHHRSDVLRGDPNALLRVVADCVRIKAEVVGLDERESGLRMLLNLGHTLGHAIEAATRYTQLLHGEAVGWGMLAAVHLAESRGALDGSDADRMRAVIRAYGPLPSFTASPEDLVALTAKDKKNREGARSFVLPTGIGSAEIVRDVTEAELLDAARVIVRRSRSIAARMNAEPTINPGARPAAEASEAAAAEHVRSLFNSIAPSYDRLNHLLSFGLDRLWWRKAAHRFSDVLSRPDASILDICCGTGDMTAALLALRPPEAEPVIGLDFSPEMLSRARAKYTAATIRWIEGDAMHLPFADASLDLVTSAFGFRNLSNYAAGLREIARVLKPGGSVGILECNQPTGMNGVLYNLYFHRILPVVGGAISGDRAAYRYLPASVERFPRPPHMLAMMAEAGFTNAGWDGYLLHAAGLYHAEKAASGG